MWVRRDYTTGENPELQPLYDHGIIIERKGLNTYKVELPGRKRKKCMVVNASKLKYHADSNYDFRQQYRDTGKKQVRFQDLKEGPPAQPQPAQTRPALLPMLDLTKGPYNLTLMTTRSGIGQGTRPRRSRRTPTHSWNKHHGMNSLRSEQRARPTMGGEFTFIRLRLRRRARRNLEWNSYHPHRSTRQRKESQDEDEDEEQANDPPTRGGGTMISTMATTPGSTILTTTTGTEETCCFGPSMAFPLEIT